MDIKNAFCEIVVQYIHLISLSLHSSPSRPRAHKFKHIEKNFETKGEKTKEFMSVPHKMMAEQW